MWQQIKDVVFHQVVQHGAASAAAVLLTYLSRPEVMATLAAAGVTVDPTKLSPAVLVAGTFVLTTAYHLIRNKIESGSASPTTAAPGK